MYVSIYPSIYLNIDKHINTYTLGYRYIFSGWIATNERMQATQVKVNVY